MKGTYKTGSLGEVDHIQLDLSNPANDVTDNDRSMDDHNSAKKLRQSYQQKCDPHSGADRARIC